MPGEESGRVDPADPGVLDSESAEKAAREKALQDLADLTEELGLYDGVTLEDARAAVEELRNRERCPFCGTPMPCASHRMGGPA